MTEGHRSSSGSQLSVDDCGGLNSRSPGHEINACVRACTQSRVLVITYKPGWIWKIQFTFQKSVVV